MLSEPRGVPRPAVAWTRASIRAGAARLAFHIDDPADDADRAIEG